MQGKTIWLILRTIAVLSITLSSLVGFETKTALAAGAGWLGTWQYRTQIRIDYSKIDSVLTNYPVLIHLSSSSGVNSANMSAVFTTLGSDANRTKIAVTTSDGTTQCYVEIEKWDTANKQADLYAKVPTINYKSNTTLYLYYDSAQPANVAYVGDTGSVAARAVWDSNFKDVLHLAQSGIGVNGEFLDSTANANNGTGGPTGVNLTQIQIMLFNNGGTGTNYLEDYNYNDTPSYAAKLHIEYTVGGIAQTPIDVQVNAAINDTNYFGATPSWNNNNGRGYVGIETGGSGALATSKMFTVPNLNGATITSAYISLYSTPTGSPTIKIQADKRREAVVPNSLSGFTSITPTAASVAWSPTGSGYSWKNSPDISAVIQELVGLPPGTGSSPTLVGTATGPEQYFSGYSGAGGNNQYISVADNDALSQPTTGQLTISFWLDPTVTDWWPSNPPITSSGTAIFTNNSATVTGIGTNWTSALVGQFIGKTSEIDNSYTYPETATYYISSVNSPTSLTLYRAYARSTGTTDYTIINVMDYINMLGKGRGDINPKQFEWVFTLGSEHSANKPSEIAFYIHSLDGGQGDGAGIYHHYDVGDKLYVSGYVDQTTVYLRVFYPDGQNFFDARGYTVGMGANGTAPVMIGGDWASDQRQWYKGNLGELRISNVVRSYAWMKADNYSGRDALLYYGDGNTLVQIYEYNNNDNGGASFGGATWKGQTFTPSATHSLQLIKVKLARGSTAGVGNVNVYVRATSGGLPTGAVLSSGSMLCSSVSDVDYAVYVFTMSPVVTLSAGTTYALSFSAPSMAAGSMYFRYQGSNGYLNGNQLQSSNSGSTWTASLTSDLYFEEWGIPLTTTNHAPMMGSLGDQQTTVGQTLSFTVSATDQDGDTLTFSASNLPSGATFNTSTHAFSWTPSANQAGSYPGVTFQVSDGYLTDSKSITITVGATTNAWDVNRDGFTNVLDMVTVGQCMGQTGSPGWIPSDVNKDGGINVLDMTIIGQHWTG